MRQALWRNTSAGLAVFACAAAFGQATQSPTFEVASVRPAAPTASGRPLRSMSGGPGTADPERIAYTGVPLKSVVVAAYGVKSYQVSGPAWIDTETYDITAKVPAGATKEQFNLMLQNLLKERFNLTLDHEAKDLAVYELVAGKNGPKLKEAAPAVNPPPDAAASQGPRFDKDGFPDLAAGRTATASVMGRDGRRRLAARKQTMAGLATILESAVDRPVVDKTGLTGEYDFKLDFSMFAPAAAPGASPTDPQPEGGASIFTAVQEQLGLKLEAKKDPIDCLVIDNAEKVPADN